MKKVKNFKKAVKVKGAVTDKMVADSYGSIASFYSKHKRNHTNPVSLIELPYLLKK